MARGLHNTFIVVGFRWLIQRMNTKEDIKEEKSRKSQGTEEKEPKD